MMRALGTLRDRLRRYRLAEDGVATLAFVVAFPVFMFVFLMTIESGIINLRKFMVEHALDRAIREVRLGNMIDPTPDKFRDEMCRIIEVIPNCRQDLRIEMVRKNIREWTPVSPQVNCVNREDPDDGNDIFVDEFGNNELMYLRVCARVDPFMANWGLGLRVVQASADDATAGGSYAIVASSAFVVEPFRAE